MPRTVMWISKKLYDRMAEFASRLETTLATKEAEVLRLVNEVKVWSTRGRIAEEKNARLEALQETLRERVTQAEKRAATATASETVYRTQLNEVKLERAELLAKLLNVDIKVATIETPIGVSPSEGGGVDFNDMGDAAAAAAGYKDMHDIPPSRPVELHD